MDIAIDNELYDSLVFCEVLASELNKGSTEQEALIVAWLKFLED
jgi:hypothetical protein